MWRSWDESGDDRTKNGRERVGEGTEVIESRGWRYLRSIAIEGSEVGGILAPIADEVTESREGLGFEMMFDVFNFFLDGAACLHLS